MKRIRSLANSPRLDKHEKPNRAKVKKNMPVKQASARYIPIRTKEMLTQSILESTNIVRHVMVEQSTEH